MILYRPVGHNELALIVESGLKGFPPRLPDQPIFYPVLNAGYAKQIALEWNTKSDTFSGYVTRFNIDNDYAQKFNREIVGGKVHEELWVPSEELSEFNQKIVGHIEIISAYFGTGFKGSSPNLGFANLSANAEEYLQLMIGMFECNLMDFRGAVVINYKSVFCNYAFWKQFDVSLLKATREDSREKLLPAIKDAWHSNFPGVALPTESEIYEYEAKQLA